MITIKSTNRFFDFYRQDKIDDIKNEYIPKTTDIKEVILNMIRFNCPDPIIFISTIPDKFNEYKVVIRSNELRSDHSTDSALYFKFNKEDTVVILCDIDINNRLIINMSTSY